MGEPPRPLDLSGKPLLATRGEERLFVDRAESIEEIRDVADGGLNALLLGERGSGKTSLLRHVARRFEREGWRAVFVEGSLATTPGDLLGLIRARVSPTHVLPSATEQLGAVIGAFGALGRPGEVPRRLVGAPGESEFLLETIRALANDLAEDDRRHVVLVDEVAAPDLVHSVFGRLRDEIWQLPAVWIVAGDVRDRHVYLSPPADAFFARTIYLPPLTDEQALELLRRRIPRSRASDRLLRAIVAQSTRHPRDLVRRAADVVVAGVPPERVANARKQRDALLDSLGEPAQRVVAELEASGPASASDDGFLARLGFGRTRAVQILRELEKLGIVESSLDRSAGQRPRKVYGVRGES